MNVLLTNDDGINGTGIWALAAELKNRGHEVTIAAPFTQQSGMSHALSVLREIEYKKFPNSTCEAWIFDGTPTDCVKIYLEAINKDKKFDAAVSGINDGANLATDVLYSGTVGAALETFLHNIPSLAVSRDKNSEIPFEIVAQNTVSYFEKVLALNLDTFLHNVNFPVNFRSNNPEYLITRLGQRDYINAFQNRVDKDGKTYFHIGGTIFDTDSSKGTDIFAVNQGFIAVTPLISDVSDYDSVIELRKVFRG
ncbi:MAG: 5'/3'-nucleotidase SurE [Selenomonadaceae bacterium]|nr:5'/3'-nucleotidase SurE [Selenomonadaceae bacterium]